MYSRASSKTNHTQVAIYTQMYLLPVNLHPSLNHEDFTRQHVVCETHSNTFKRKFHAPRKFRYKNEDIYPSRDFSTVNFLPCQQIKDGTPTLSAKWNLDTTFGTKDSDNLGFIVSLNTEIRAIKQMKGY